MLKEKKRKKYKIKTKPSFVKEFEENYFVNPAKAKKAINSFLTIKEASEFASSYLKRNVTTSNISYLIQYGRIRKIGGNGSTLIDKNELIKYYESYNGTRAIDWKEKLGNDLNWTLSFDEYKEAETTKHVHRLHPYKGKLFLNLLNIFLTTRKTNLKRKFISRKMI